ncbi:MAG: FtsB family cell division protein [Blastocatellia bacterium]
MSTRQRSRAAGSIRRPQPKGVASSMPGWVPVVTALTLTVMLCLTINFRAHSELSREEARHDALNLQIEAITSENLSLQEQIHYLKNDSKTIEREARKFGLRPREERVSEPTK